MATDDLAHLDATFAALMANLGPSWRGQAARQIARTLRGTQAKRIAALKDPDGVAYAPRKKPAKQKPAVQAKQFLYSAGGSGEGRKVTLANWVIRGGYITGWDVEAKGERTFKRAKIIKFIEGPPSKDAGPARSLRARATIKNQLMFRKLRTFRELKSGSDAQGAYVGFTGRTAAMARVHQEGGLDRASPRAPLVRYAQRRLLGLTETERATITDIMMAMISELP